MTHKRFELGKDFHIPPRTDIELRNYGGMVMEKYHTNEVAREVQQAYTYFCDGILTRRQAFDSMRKHDLDV